MESGLILAFLVTLGAGLATGIGSTLAFFTKTTNKSFFAIAMGFSAGVMVYLSFVEILPKSTQYISETTSPVQASAVAAIAMVAGMIVMAIIDALVPSGANPHENTEIELLGTDAERSEARANKILLRTGLFVALAIAIHNFPEGLATFLLVLDDPEIGIALAIAAVDNVLSLSLSELDGWKQLEHCLTEWNHNRWLIDLSGVSQIEVADFGSSQLRQVTANT